jgi:hypothetical protein
VCVCFWQKAEGITTVVFSRVQGQLIYIARIIWLGLFCNVIVVKFWIIHVPFVGVGNGLHWTDGLNCDKDRVERSFDLLFFIYRIMCFHKQYACSGIKENVGPCYFYIKKFNHFWASGVSFLQKSVVIKLSEIKFKHNHSECMNVNLGGLLDNL